MERDGKGEGLEKEGIQDVQEKRTHVPRRDGSRARADVVRNRGDKISTLFVMSRPSRMFPAGTGQA